MEQSHDWFKDVQTLAEVLKNSATVVDDQVEAAKALAGMAKSDNLNDQMSQQKAIVLSGAAHSLLKLVRNSKHEQLQWWVSLAMTQFVYANELVVEKLVDFQYFSGREERMRAAFPNMAEDEIGEEELAQVEQALRTSTCLMETIAGMLSNFPHYTTDRVKFGFLHAATNIANAHWRSHELFFRHGIVNKVRPILLIGNTPALVSAAVSFLAALSYNKSSCMPLIRARVVPSIANIARTERQDLNSMNADVARRNIQGTAASKIQALGRGFLTRGEFAKELHARKMRRLMGFFTNLVVYKCFLLWKFFRAQSLEFKAKLRRATASLFQRSLYLGFRSMKMNVELKAQRKNALQIAMQFAKQSSSASHLCFSVWYDYMLTDGPWWSPDAKLEEEVKKRCSRFLSLMSGQWTHVCFSEWKEILVKKHRAMKRWMNAMLFFGWDLWVEYMCTEGSWWEPDAAVKRLLEEKCSNFLAAMSGNYMQACFQQWRELVGKNKRARARFFNSSLSKAMDAWVDETFYETAMLMERVQERCGKVLALITGEFFSACFLSWMQHTSKMKRSRRFLEKVVRGPMVKGWENWVEVMCVEGPWWQPDDEIMTKLRDKCSNILALLGGDLLRSVVWNWSALARKNKRAMIRWKRQSEYEAWRKWREYCKVELEMKTITRAIQRKREISHKWEALVDWEYIIRSIRYNRSLVADALMIWLNVRKVHAFRAFDELVLIRKYFRAVIAKFRERFRMRPAQRCVLALHDYVERMAHMRFIVNRIKNRNALTCLLLWSDLVQDTKIALREQMCASSALLLRWLKRPMYQCFELWRDKWQELRRNRRILERMAYRMKNACVVASFNDWNRFVDIMVEERFEELKLAVSEALQRGQMTKFVESVVKQRRLFHRSNVRWNEFVRTYLEDVMREVVEEEENQVEQIYMRLKRRRRRQEKFASPAPASSSPHGLPERGRGQEMASSSMEDAAQKAPIARSKRNRSNSLRQGGQQIIPPYLLKLRSNPLSVDMSNDGYWNKSDIITREREIKDNLRSSKNPELVEKRAASTMPFISSNRRPVLDQEGEDTKEKTKEEEGGRKDDVSNKLPQVPKLR